MISGPQRRDSDTEQLVQAIDYSRLLDRATSYTFLSPDLVLDEASYRGEQGIKFCSERGRRLWECVRLAEGALLIASRDHGSGVQRHRQVVTQSDWVHIQFRLNGGGFEAVDRSKTVQTPQGCCIVSRYPANSVVERTVDATNGCKVACLLTTPVALACLLDVSAARLPEYVQWLSDKEHPQPWFAALPLQSSMAFAVNDILSCPFRGNSRRTYMRGKSLDLLATVISALGGPASGSTPTLRLSPADLEKFALVRSVMCAHLDGRWTLGELARRVGINRNKLALGFKAVYGVSVQSFWRDARLDRARQVLEDGATSVTEVALSSGYSGLASFTRAFTRRFAIAPRECNKRAVAYPRV